jgi:hypothetical protein
MKDFLNPRWADVLRYNGLGDFDSLWALDVGWFEAPNRRRGGWSGVSRCELPMPPQESRGVFVKRQENHKTFSWCHPIAGIPTFLREFRLIVHYKACGIPALEPVYFGVRRFAGGHRAILATEELTDFISLESQVQIWLESGFPPASARRPYLHAIADLSSQIHRNKIQHNCYYPKHIFVRMRPEGGVEARVIDLEKSRLRLLSLPCALRDLDTLNRHAPEWSRGDRLRFLKSYLGIGRLTPYAKWLWRRLAARAMRKSGAGA